MRKVTRIIIGIILIIGMIIPVNSIVKASDPEATTSIAFSESTISVGDEVTVTVTVSSEDEKLLGGDLYIYYDDDMLELTDGSGADGEAYALDFYDGSGSSSISTTFTFEAIATGSASISVDSTNTYVEGVSTTDGWDITGSSASLTIEANEDASADNSLSDLVVTGLDSDDNATTLTLSPSFYYSTTSYTCTASSDTVELSLSATASDDNATVEISGTSVSEGKNKTYIYVTAENGDQATYTITTTVSDSSDDDSTTSSDDSTTSDDTDSSSPTVDGEEMTISDDSSDLTVPDGFSEIDYTYNGEDYTFYQNDTTGLIIVCLTDEDGNEAWYVYDEDNDIFYAYQVLTSSKQSYTILQGDDTIAEEIPDGFSSATITIGDLTVEGWIYDDDTDFCIVYAMNEDGESALYMYDFSENTMQRLLTDFYGSDSSDEDTDNGQGMSTIEIIELVIIIALAAGVIALIVLLKKSKNDKNDPDPDNKEITTDYENGQKEVEEEQIETEENQEKTEKDQKEEPEEVKKAITGTTVKEKKRKKPKDEELTDEEREFIKKIREENEDGEFFETEIDFDDIKDSSMSVNDDLDREIRESNKRVENTLNVNEKKESEEEKSEFDYLDFDLKDED